MKMFFKLLILFVYFVYFVVKVFSLSLFALIDGELLFCLSSHRLCYKAPVDLHYFSNKKLIPLTFSDDERLRF